MTLSSSLNLPLIREITSSIPSFFGCPCPRRLRLSIWSWMVDFRKCPSVISKRPSRRSLSFTFPSRFGKVKDKLRLDGRFDITEGHFLKSTIQDQIDSLSRRGQGQPKNEGIDEVISRMRGSFKLDDSVITFRELTFGVDGADVQLAGSYDLNADVLDFHGALKLEAKVSQTVTGWKQRVPQPDDPLPFSHGARVAL